MKYVQDMLSIKEHELTMQRFFYFLKYLCVCVREHTHTHIFLWWVNMYGCECGVQRLTFLPFLSFCTTCSLRQGLEWDYTVQLVSLKPSYAWIRTVPSCLLFVVFTWILQIKLESLWFHRWQLLIKPSPMPKAKI